jgi:hypothetical protein
MTPSMILLTGLEAVHTELHTLDRRWTEEDHRKLHEMINCYRVITDEGDAIDFETEENYLYENKN